LGRKDIDICPERVNNNKCFRSSLVVQWVKDPALTQHRLRSLLWHRFSPLPRNFLMPRTQPKRKKKSFKATDKNRIFHKIEHVELSMENDYKS